MHPADHLVILAYLALTIGLGVYFGRQHSRDEFFAASHAMGWLTVGLSVMATLFSSNSFVMYPSAAYGDSLRLSLTLIAHTAILPLIVWVFIPVYTRLKCRTAYEYLERRFHVSVRCLASGLFILLRIGWMASATFAASLVMANISGISQTTVIVGLGVVAVVYTMLGGLRAVMWTDVIQFFVFSATIILAMVLLFSLCDGGVTGAFETYFAGRENVVVDFSPSLTLKYGSWAILIGVFLEALSAFGADQVAVQRYLAARSEATSQWGFVINIVGIWLVVPALLMIGVGLYALYDERPQELVPLLVGTIEANPDAVESLALDLPANATAEAITTYFEMHPEAVATAVRKLKLDDQALPQFVKQRFPPGAIGLFLAALMAAIMSSIDSGVHSVTTALVVDFRDRLLPHRRPVDDADDVRMLRTLIVLIGAIVVTLACFVGPLGNVFDIGKKLTAAFGGPLLAVFCMALFFPRVTTAGVFIGTLCSATVTLLLMYQQNDWFSVWYWPIGFGLAFLIGVPMSRISLLWNAGTGDPAMTFREIVRLHTSSPADAGQADAS